MGVRTAVVALLCMLFAAVAAGKEPRKMTAMTLTSPAFAEGGAIPARHTCDGADTSPPLVIANVPAGANSLALIVDDPDAPVGTWVHWVVWGIPPHTREIAENRLPAGAQQGRNDWKRNSYGGPCPPSGTHRYFFKLYALDTSLALGADTTKKELERAMSRHILAHVELKGTYRRR